MIAALGYIGGSLGLLYYYTKDDTVPVLGLPHSNSLDYGEAVIAGLFLLSGLMMLIGAIIWRGRKVGASMILAWILMLCLSIAGMMTIGALLMPFVILGFPAALQGVRLLLDGLGQAEQKPNEGSKKGPDTSSGY